MIHWNQSSAVGEVGAECAYDFGSEFKSTNNGVPDTPQLANGTE
jgi:hypothetical protein